MLTELDWENLTARVREAHANFQVGEAGYQAAVAQLNKNEIEAESPDVDFARRNHARAEQFTNATIRSSIQATVLTPDVYTAVLIGVATISSLLPAIRTSRTDPIEALRYE